MKTALVSFFILLVACVIYLARLGLWAVALNLAWQYFAVPILYAQPMEFIEVIKVVFVVSLLEILLAFIKGLFTGLKGQKETA